MTTVLPNGIKVFNSTPHPITLWCEDWGDVVIVPVDEIINALPLEYEDERLPLDEKWGKHAGMCSFEAEHMRRLPAVTFVRTVFVGDDAGRAIIERAYEQGADIVIGSMIAAQAYPMQVVGMTPCAGYERVPPEEKRMRGDKFVVFPKPHASN